MSALGTHLCECTSWRCCVRLCEAVFGFSEFFFEDYFSSFAHFLMGDLQAHLPTLHWVFSSFWPKMAWPPCPTLPNLLYGELAPEWLFYFIKKSLSIWRSGKVYPCPPLEAFLNFTFRATFPLELTLVYGGRQEETVVTTATIQSIGTAEDWGELGQETIWSRKLWQTNFSKQDFAYLFLLSR